MKNVIPDVLDNFSRRSSTPAFEHTFDYMEEVAPLLEQLCPHILREKLQELTKNVDKGTFLRARILIGSIKDGTSHPHDFVIEKNSDSTSFYFIDPEHYVGERNWRRPSIGNLMTLRIYNFEQLPEVSIIRFRTNKLADADRTALKMTKQLYYARSLLDTSEIPIFLAETPEEITFYVTVQTGKKTHGGTVASVQSRYVTHNDLENFINGKNTALTLEGKIESQRAILNSFVEFLEKKSFKVFTPRVVESRHLNNGH